MGRLLFILYFSNSCLFENCKISINIKIIVELFLPQCVVIYKLNDNIQNTVVVFIYPYYEMALIWDVNSPSNLNKRVVLAHMSLDCKKG